MNANHVCLNCSKDVLTTYCGHCGQKASTHRYSMVHFVEHDLIHGVWHVDKGILRTIKDLFSRPGHSIRDFILGKRASYFNFVTLLLTLLAISTIIASYARFNMLDLLPPDAKSGMNNFQKFTTNHPKIMLLITIPFYSVFSLLWFNKAKFNFSEHLVLNSYKAAAEMIISIVFTSLTIFYYNKAVLLLVYSMLFLGSVIYTIWFYRQFFSSSGYSKFGLVGRSIMVPVSYLLFSFLVGMVYGILQGLGK